jgi:hypothetical protein
MLAHVLGARERGVLGRRVRQKWESPLFSPPGVGWLVHIFHLSPSNIVAGDLGCHRLATIPTVRGLVVRDLHQRETISPLNRYDVCRAPPSGPLYRWIAGTTNPCLPFSTNRTATPYYLSLLPPTLSPFVFRIVLEAHRCL